MTNLGSLDRTLRLVAGIILLVLPFLLAGEAGVMAAMGGFAWVSLLVGVVLAATAIFRFCPAYWMFGIRTCKTGGGAKPTGLAK
ncbi:YgaP-like transmembrane domain [Thalassospira mesophila]|uniref:YgaP-like transmembrane domain n=1 Tax=Thalassospira mesophila TaxID=1293891 RepID=UPI000A1F36E1